MRGRMNAGAKVSFCLVDHQSRAKIQSSRNMQTVAYMGTMPIEHSQLPPLRDLGMHSYV